MVDASLQAVREATRMIEAGQIATRIDPRPFTLDDVLEAYDSARRQPRPAGWSWISSLTLIRRVGLQRSSDPDPSRKQRGVHEQSRTEKGNNSHQQPLHSQPDICQRDKQRKRNKIKPHH